MKKYEVKNLYEILNSLGDVEASVKFNYAVVKNLKTLQSEIEVYDEVIEKLYTYTDEENELLKKVDTKEIEFESLDKELQAKVNDIFKNINEFYNGEADINLHKIDINEMPDGLSLKIFNQLMLIVKEEE